MQTLTINIPRAGVLRIRRNGRAYFATLGEWEILGCVYTLAYGLLISGVSTIIDSFKTN